MFLLGHYPRPPSKWQHCVRKTPLGGSVRWGTAHFLGWRRPPRQVNRWARWRAAADGQPGASNGRLDHSSREQVYEKLFAEVDASRFARVTPRLLAPIRQAAGDATAGDEADADGNVSVSQAHMTLRTFVDYMRRAVLVQARRGPAEPFGRSSDAERHGSNGDVLSRGPRRAAHRRQHHARAAHRGIHPRRTGHRAADLARHFSAPARAGSLVFAGQQGGHHHRDRESRHPLGDDAVPRLGAELRAVAVRAGARVRGDGHTAQLAHVAGYDGFFRGVCQFHVAGESAFHPDTATHERSGQRGERQGGRCADELRLEHLQRRSHPGAVLGGGTHRAAGDDRGRFGDGQCAVAAAEFPAAISGMASAGAESGADRSGEFVHAAAAAADGAGCARRASAVVARAAGVTSSEFPGAGRQTRGHRGRQRRRQIDHPAAAVPAVRPAGGRYLHRRPERAAGDAIVAARRHRFHPAGGGAVQRHHLLQHRLRQSARRRRG
eukprot:ctg_26.g1